MVMMIWVVYERFGFVLIIINITARKTQASEQHITDRLEATHPTTAFGAIKCFINSTNTALVNEFNILEWEIFMFLCFHLFHVETRNRLKMYEKRFRQNETEIWFWENKKVFADFDQKLSRFREKGKW